MNQMARAMRAAGAGAGVAIVTSLLVGCGGGAAPEPPVAATVTRLMVQDVVRDETLMGLDVGLRGTLDSATVASLKAHPAIVAVERRVDEASGAVRVDVRANSGDIGSLNVYTDPKTDRVLGFYCELRSPERKSARRAPDAWRERCRRFGFEPRSFFGTVECRGATPVFWTDRQRRYAAVRDRRLVGFLVASTEFFRRDCHGFQSRAQILADAQQRVKEKRPRDEPLIDYEITGVELKALGRQLARLRESAAAAGKKEKRRGEVEQWEAFLAEVRDEPLDVKVQRVAEARKRLPRSARHVANRPIRADARRELKAPNVGAARRTVLEILAKSGYVDRAESLLSYANTIDRCPDLPALAAWVANRDPRAKKRFARRVAQAVRARAADILETERKALEERADATNGATVAALGFARWALRSNRPSWHPDLAATARWLERCRAYDERTDPFEQVSVAPWLEAPMERLGRQLAKKLCPPLVRRLDARANAAAAAGRKATAAACWLAAAVVERDTWPPATTAAALVGRGAEPEAALGRARRALLVESLQFVPTPERGADDLDPVLIDGAALDWPIVSKLGIAFATSSRRRAAIVDAGGGNDTVAWLLNRDGRVGWVDVARSLGEDELPGTAVRFLVPTASSLSAPLREASDALTRERAALKAEAAEIDKLPPPKDSDEHARRWRVRNEFVKRQDTYNQRLRDWGDAAAKELAPMYAAVRARRRAALDDYVDTSLMVYARLVRDRLGPGADNEREVAWMHWFFGRTSPGFEGLPIERGPNENSRAKRCDRLEREALEQAGRAAIGRAIAAFWDRATDCALDRRAPRTRKLIDDYRTTFTLDDVFEHIVQVAKHRDALASDVLNEAERDEIARIERARNRR